MTVPLAARIDGPPDALPLVLLNSVGTTTAMWDPCLAPLAEQFRVIRLDTRGHGDSPASPPGPPTTIADLGRDVLAALDGLGLARVHLAGLSIGGMTGMWLAAHHPERIGRLALLCTSAHLPPAEGWYDRARTVRTAGMAPIVDATLGRWLTAAIRARDAELVDGLRAMLLGIDPEGYAQCCEAIGALDLRPDLARIAVPTLVIAGADDPTATPAHAEVIAAGVAASRLAVLDSAAHLATYEQPGRIAALLLEHFSAAATAATGYATRRSVLGDAHVDATVAGTDAFTGPFQDFLTRYAWGDVWSRPGLARRDRSLLTLACLVTLGAEPELALHVRGAVRNGLTADEIAEALLHTAVYAGLPRANRAVAIARRVLAEPAAETTERPSDHA